MSSSAAPPRGTLYFQCNICGEDCAAASAALGREVVSCPACGSSPRQRAIIVALSMGLFGTSMPLVEFPTRKDITGLGMTDWPGYAGRLAEKFSYVNTYFHDAPHLDISAAQLPSEFEAKNDFIISSEVFEHIVPPVDLAFQNVRKLLKPGGVFVLTAPYGTQAMTQEHFPDLHDFTITEADGKYRLRNITREGVVQEFDNLVFHGGPGSTLEMRVFSEADLVRHLAQAGFENITVHNRASLEFGVWWPEPWAFPLSARKPIA